MKVKVNLLFEDKTLFNLEMTEDDLLKQMNKPQDKRNYIYGVDFSKLLSAGVEK